MDPVEANAVVCPDCKEGILTGIMVLRAQLLCNFCPLCAIETFIEKYLIKVNTFNKIMHIILMADGAYDTIVPEGMAGANLV